MKRQMVLISIIVLFLLLLSLYACDVDSVQVVEEYPLSDAEVSAYLDYAIDINALSNTKTDSLKDTILRICDRIDVDDTNWNIYKSDQLPDYLYHFGAMLNIEETPDQTKLYILYRSDQGKTVILTYTDAELYELSVYDPLSQEGVICRTNQSVRYIVKNNHSKQEYNNITYASHAVAVSESGVLTVSNRYSGSISKPSFVFIETLIEKRKWLFFWQQIEPEKGIKQWEDYSNDISYVKDHKSVLAKTGTYRITTRFTVSGFSSTPDEIVCTTIVSW